MKSITVKVLFYKLDEVRSQNLPRILNGKVYQYDLAKIYMEVSNFEASAPLDTLRWMTPTRTYLSTLLTLFNGPDNPILSDEEMMRNLDYHASPVNMTVGDVVVMEDSTFREYWRLSSTG